MKCQNCGNNNAVFHYKANINGQTIEQHLCGECAEKAGLTEENFFGGDMFQSMFSDLFREFFAPSKNSYFPEVGRLIMPVMAVPRIEFVVKKDEVDTSSATENPVTQKDEGMSRRREANILRTQLGSAIEAEEFEKAAELRDKIRELEKKD